jgi:hypothetical protein
MTRKAILSLLAAILTSPLFAAEGPVPKGIPHLDHVFVIMMENHGYSQIIGNPNAPFTNYYANAQNMAANYFAVGHPSLTNYLEVAGGSNFGVLDDNSPDWHNPSCMPNLQTGTPSLESTSTAICPITGTGTDAATPAIDFTNETSGPPGDINVNGTVSFPAESNTLGITIADQLVAANKSWRSYQESLPLTGADNVDYSDGFFTNLTDFSQITPALNPPLTSSDVVQLYAVKHNPFVYFSSVQSGELQKNSLANVAGFNELYADLSSGHVRSYSFIAPNQCDDQHGRGNAGPFCNYDPNDDGTQAGLNPALIYQGDVTIHRLVAAIKDSPSWRQGNNAIVILWDENDYSVAPTTNQVLTIVDTNYGVHGVRSHQFYTHYSLLKSIEAGMGLPCLNHACDANVNVMTDMFGAKKTN